MPTGTRLVDKWKPVVALHAVVPSSANPKWVSLKGYNHASVIVTFSNTTTVTGSAIALQQATAVAGTGAKALQFTDYFACIDDSVSVAMTELFAVGGTFTTDPTNSKSGFYVIELDSFMLDDNHGFTCIQATVGNGVATTVEVIYLLGASGRYEAAPESMMDPLAN
jgi:hypothetical protein